MSSTDHGPPLPENLPESPPVRLAARLASLIWWLLLVVLVLFALYAGLGRQLTRNVDSFRDDLARELSDRLGHNVSIGSLSSRWYWLDPSFSARDIRVSNTETGVVVANLEYLNIRLDALASLRRLRVVFEDFEAEGLELTVTREQSGNVAVLGADIPGLVSNQLHEWLELAGNWLSDPHVKFTRVDLGIRDSQGNRRHLDIPQLDLEYRRGLFHASGRAMQSGTTQQLASFALVGEHFFRGDFTGQLYLDVDSGRLFDDLIDEYQWRMLRLEGFDLGGEAWLTFRDGQLQQVTGSVRTPYLQLGVGHESLAPLEDIRARFGWRRHHSVMADEKLSGSDSFALGEWHIKQLQWTWNGDVVSPFSLRLAPSDGGMSVIADALPLAPTRRLASRLPILPEPALRALRNYRPGGFLDQLEVYLPDQSPEKFELSGRLRDASVRAYGGAPGVTSVNGTIFLDRNSGYVRVATGEAPVSLEFPELFGGAWSFPALEGQIAWQLDGPITRVFSDSVRMVYNESTEIEGAFDLKLDREGEDNLGLRVSLKNGTAGMLADFVPVKVVNPGLYEWLTTAILEADITSGVYYGHGQIGPDAPRGTFVSSMGFQFDQATVRYDENWPEVRSARGRVEVHNGNTLVSLDAGKTGGLNLNPSSVRVIPGENARVRVDVSARVPGESLGYWMDNSPLGEMAGREARKLQYGGQYQLVLGIDLPLGSGQAPVVEANIAVADGSVVYPSAGLAWEDVHGELTYHSEDGFSGGPLAAKFFGEPVTMAFSRARSGAALSVSQSGELPVPGVFASAGLSAKAGLGLQGRVSYIAELDMGVDSTSGIRVRSSLEGLAVEWPEPLSKPAGEAAPLRAVIKPSAAGGLSITGEWENRLAFDLLWKKTGFDLRLDHIYLGNQLLTDIDINALDLGDRWVVKTDSKRARGQVLIPDNGDTIMADFEVLRLMRGEGTAKEPADFLTLNKQLEAFRALDMGNWPDIDVTIADLQLNADSLGGWAFRLRPEPHRLNVTDMEGRLNSLTLTGNMTWSIVDERETSRFWGAITGGALADLNNLFDTDMPVTNEATNIQLDLDWPGRPDEFSIAELNGSVSLRLDEGVILERNNSAQLFRIFNLLNSDTLWRRLKLDFSDLYERGVAFDAISGKAQITRGLLTMDPELQVVGPSGAFKLSGATNMASEQLNMRLVVVLPLTQNLPLAALLMGAGAPIGGALFVLDKVLGDPLSKLTSATYRVTGTWGQPKVDLQRVFDTGQ
ncbi:AsmA-like C-terminal region-containing protein [uncultured Marinobacter sp.]|uniref:YhdP family phospholipid transporter n=1 Tax=uncultured Marinobacter sp. TaxID=187379 RepID=UPI0030D8015E|tara:strand:+ start:22861 stop:26613 length:3753 start_codon:yes stop_codon:yes gene_type:complete